MLDIRKILQDPNLQADMVYDFTRKMFSNEEGLKYGVRVLITAIERHPDMLEYLKRLNTLLTNLISKLEGGKQNEEVEADT